MRPIRRNSYRFAIDWIALNDNPVEDDRDQVMRSVTVDLIADMFKLSPATVAYDVCYIREAQHEGEATP